MNSRRRIPDPSRWISEPYHNDGCRERRFALVPMFAALRTSDPLLPTADPAACPQLVEGDIGALKA
jgi:hypothetical protein